MPHRSIVRHISITLSVSVATILMGCASETEAPAVASATMQTEARLDTHDTATSYGSGTDHLSTLPTAHRLAFMSGHVEAGLALYRAGEAAMGAPHLLHPVSETHQSEREGLDAIGFEPEIFETVSEALEQGRPASEIEPQLAAAQKNLQDMAERAGGDSADIIRFLMTTLMDEYIIAITDGTVSDPGEYQDAWGFAIVARQHAERLNTPMLYQALSDLIALWPDTAPIPPQDPTDIDTVSEHVDKVLNAL